MALTAKAKRFVEEYMVDRNASKAAIRAGYSERSAGSIGSELLKKPEIKQAVEDREKELLENIKLKVDISKESLLANLELIMMENLSQGFDGANQKVAIDAIKQMALMLGYDKPEDTPETKVRDIQVTIVRKNNTK